MGHKHYAVWNDTTITFEDGKWFKVRLFTLFTIFAVILIVIRFVFKGMEHGRVENSHGSKSSSLCDVMVGLVTIYVVFIPSFMLTARASRSYTRSWTHSSRSREKAINHGYTLDVRPGLFF